MQRSDSRWWLFSPKGAIDWVIRPDGRLTELAGLWHGSGLMPSQRIEQPGNCGHRED